VSLSSDTVYRLVELEQSMWRAETRFDRAYMLRTLTPDFHEFGRSGRTYDLDEILKIEGETIVADLGPMTVSEIAPGVALVTYVSAVCYDEIELSNRSSLWITDGDAWRLRFHQGTPTAE
jgi:hypothetical protein